MYKQFSRILTKDDREAIIVDVYKSPPGYAIEYIDEPGSTYGLLPEKIKKLIEGA
ncbi:hypothetical protein [Numidum massiliense]|uniref:hypothetical protein n=1 Tax=Numidum massiliense TaxID=1522315 RepID=UPI0012FBC043|nr:hypothetical protein [Numidum massiliense]